MIMILPRGLHIVQTFTDVRRNAGKDYLNLI